MDQDCGGGEEDQEHSGASREALCHGAPAKGHGRRDRDGRARRTEEHCADQESGGGSAGATEQGKVVRDGPGRGGGGDHIRAGQGAGEASHGGGDGGRPGDDDELILRDFLTWSRINKYGKSILSLSVSFDEGIVIGLVDMLTSGGLSVSGHC